MKIVLIGYRGTGKSTVGKLLAERLEMPYISMDAEIVKNAGMSVPEIVAKYGWPGFRNMESELALDLSKKDGIIVDTGGGIIERPGNIEALKAGACIFWLKASVDTIVLRIQGGTERPSLTEGKSFTEEVAEVLERRSEKYRSAADYEIDTDEVTALQIAEKIMALLNIEKT
jgi:shikimate kinase